MESLFVDREEELEALNNAYKSKGAKLVVVYGRRRIGKTELIREFIKGKTAAYYIATKESESEQLQKISRSIGLALNNDNLVKFGVTGWDMLFDNIKNCGIIIAIDEFPYLASVNKALPSIFQAGWDQYLSKSNVTLILSGSSTSMMQDEVLNYSAPLYGRSASIIKLNPIPFYEIKELMHEKMSFEDKLYSYFIFGGVAAYYKIARSQNLEGIIKKIIGETSIFLEEPSILLSEETRKDSTYINILKLIANGVNKPNEISTKLGVFQSNLNRYLSLLENTGIIKKEYPVNVNPSRKSKGGLYQINDPYTFFWASTLEKYKELIELKSPDLHEALANNIKTTIAQKRFEDFAKEFITLLSTRKKIFPITKIGRWWGSNREKSKDKTQEEIDVIALNENTKDILFAECKWSNHKTGVETLKNLQRKAQYVEWHDNQRKEHYALFSKTGFDEKLTETAGKEKTLLFNLKEIEKIINTA